MRRHRHTLRRAPGRGLHAAPDSWVSAEAPIRDKEVPFGAACRQLGQLQEAVRSVRLERFCKHYQSNAPWSMAAVRHGDRAADAYDPDRQLGLMMCRAIIPRPTAPAPGFG